MSPAKQVSASRNISSARKQALVSATQCIRHTGVIRALKFRRRLMPRRAVGTRVLVDCWGKSVLGRALEMPRRARGGQQRSAVQSDNVTDHRAAANDLQANDRTDHRRSGASDGYPPSAGGSRVYARETSTNTQNAQSVRLPNTAV